MRIGRALQPIAEGKGHEQGRGDRPGHQPALRVEPHEIGADAAIEAALVEEHGEACGADQDGIGHGPVEIELTAAGQQAVDGIQEGIEAEQHQGAAVEGQHHWLDVPVAELEAPVLSDAGDQARHEQRQPRHGGIDGGEHAVEQDRHRARQQAEQHAERRHPDGYGDGEFQESLFGGGILHAARIV